MTSRSAHDARANIEHTRHTVERFDAFIFEPGLYTRVGQPSRLRVLQNDYDESAEVIDEDTTSEAVTAESLNGGATVILLTDDRVRWLHRTLGELIARQDAQARGTQIAER